MSSGLRRRTAASSAFSLSGMALSAPAAPEGEDEDGAEDRAGGATDRAAKSGRSTVKRGIHIETRMKGMIILVMILGRGMKRTAVVMKVAMVQGLTQNDNDNDGKPLDTDTAKHDGQSDNDLDNGLCECHDHGHVVMS